MFVPLRRVRRPRPWRRELPAGYSVARRAVPARGSPVRRRMPRGAARRVRSAAGHLAAPVSNRCSASMESVTDLEHDLAGRMTFAAQLPGLRHILERELAIDPNPELAGVRQFDDGRKQLTGHVAG